MELLLSAANSRVPSADSANEVHWVWVSGVALGVHDEPELVEVQMQALDAGDNEPAARRVPSAELTRVIQSATGAAVCVHVIPESAET